MYARVEHGVVRELVETDQRIEDLYHPDLQWVDVANASGVRPGWTVGQEGFAPPVFEEVAVATPAVDFAELARRVDELQEQIRGLAPGANGQRPGEA